MIKLTQKTIIISLASIITLVLATIGVWLLLQSSATSEYNQRLQAHSNNINAALSERETAFKLLQSAPSTTKAREELAKLETALSKLTRTPDEPVIFGLRMLPQSVQNARAKRMMHIISLNSEIKQAQALLSYQEQVTTVLKDVSTKEAANLEQLKTLHAAWQGAVDKLKAIAPSDSAKEFHNELLASVETITATVSALPPLYEKRDLAGFAAKQKELESKVAGLRELAHKLHSVAVAQDEAIASRLVELRK